MDNLRAQINQIKSQLQDIQNQLSPWLNSADKFEKQNQLNAVAGSLDKLTKTEVTIPSELRELKLKLHRELDQFKEAKIINEELVEILSQFVSHKKPVRKSKLSKSVSKKRLKLTGDKIDLLCLIQNGLIQPHTKIEKVFRGIHYEAVITTIGQIELTFNGVKKTYKSPSSAAADLAQAPRNGWTWWSLEGDPKGRTLDYYRQKYIQHGKETGR